MNLRIRDLSDVSKNQSYDRSARTPAVHVSLSSDLIVKQRILFNHKAHTFNPKHLGPNLPARFSLLQENQEREAFRVSHRVSGAVDGRFIGPTHQNCQATCRRKFKNFKTPRFPRASAGENFRDAANLIAATQNFSKNLSKKSKPLLQAPQPRRQRLKMPYQNGLPQLSHHLLAWLVCAPSRSRGAGDTSNISTQQRISCTQTRDIFYNSL